MSDQWIVMELPMAYRPTEWDSYENARAYAQDLTRELLKPAAAVLLWDGHDLTVVDIVRRRDETKAAEPVDRRASHDQP